MKQEFLGKIFSRKEANVVALGVRLGKDWKASLQSLRKASRFVEPFDPRTKQNLLQGARIFDQGDLKFNYLDKIFEEVRWIRLEGKIPLLLSRCHLPTLYALGAFERETNIIIFDAHLDMKKEYMDEKIKQMNFFTGQSPSREFNDATWLRRFVEYSYHRKVVVIGARSFDEEEENFAEENGIKFFPPWQLDKSKKFLHDFSKGENYVSIDLDVFDPSIAPAVDHPEPNGISFADFCEVVNALNGKVVGLDCCCLKKIPSNETTEFLAVRAIFKVLSKI